MFLNADCISHYHISVNDGAITQTTQNTFATITELDIHTENMIEVAAIDKGNRTGNSTLIIIQLSSKICVYHVLTIYGHCMHVKLDRSRSP